MNKIKNHEWMIILSIICFITSCVGFFEASQMNEMQIDAGLQTGTIQLSFAVMAFAVLYGGFAIHIQKKETESYSKK